MKYTSVCNVLVEFSGQRWLNRLADLQDGKFVVPNIDDDLMKVFSNRDKLYTNNASLTEDFVGLWDWKASPRDTDMTKDYVTSEQRMDIRPVRVVPLSGVYSLSDLKKSIVNGVSSHRYICDTMFCYEEQSGRFVGVLCTSDQLQFDVKIRLKDDVFSLPRYRFRESDVLVVRSMRIMRAAYMGSPEGYELIRKPDKAIKGMILRRATRANFKQIVGGSKADWRNCVTLLDGICDETLYEEVASVTYGTPEEAKKLVDGFIQRAKTLFSEDDIDVETLALIVQHHDGLKRKCEAIAAQQWKKDHEAELAEV